MSLTDLSISIQPTPNPNALKFILNRPVKLKGNSTYRSPVDCGENKLAQELFKVQGIDQIHFYDNSITITKFNYEDWENIDEVLKTKIHDLYPDHNPDYHDPDPEAERREALPQELKDIEKILDKTIRPGLQGDGGDIQTISYEDNILLIKYVGACGTCPSSTTGTLYAIKSILQEEYNPDIDVYIAPDF